VPSVSAPGGIRDKAHDMLESVERDLQEFERQLEELRRAMRQLDSKIQSLRKFRFGGSNPADMATIRAWIGRAGGILAECKKLDPVNPEVQAIQATLERLKRDYPHAA
jgi:hypothetical protein